MAVLPATFWAQTQAPAPGRSLAQWDKIQISVTAKLAPNLYILQGSPDLDTTHPDAAGGRVAVLFGPDGILMVDSQDEELHEKVLQTIRTFSSAPIRFLVNSHIHPDHTGGDAFFAKQGAVIFSREELRDEMLHPPRQADGSAAPAPDPAALPVVTYRLGAPGAAAVTIHLNGEVVEFIPVPASHTGGDTVIPVPTCECALYRRFLPQFRLSLRRSSERRFDPRHACCDRPDRNDCRPRHYTHHRSWNDGQEG